MYESRVCFLFTIFVTCVQQYGQARPQAVHPYPPTQYFHSPLPYYGSYNQHAPVSFNTLLPTNHTVPPIEANQTSHPVQVPPANNNFFAPPPPVSISHGPFDPYAASNPYPPSHVPIHSPPASMFHSLPHQTPFNSVPYPGSLPPNPSYQTFAPIPPPPSSSFSMDAHSQQTLTNQNHVLQSSPVASASFHHVFHQSPYPPQPHISPQVASDAPHINYPPPPLSPHPPPPSPFAPYSGYESPGVLPYAPHNHGYGFNNMPHGIPVSNHFAGSNFAIQNRESSVTSTSKKVTPTPPRPKTTTSATPKPLEFELSIEDFFYLTQLHSMFNKSLDKQGIDISSLVSKSHKKTGEDKDESPVFYGGVLDLEELSKIDNIKDLMEVFKKGDSKSQTVSRTDGAEIGPSDNPDEDHEVDDERETHPDADSGRRKGSHSATRTRTALRNRNKKKKKKKRRKESDRVDHGNEDEEQEEEDESSDQDDSEPETTDEKIGIGSKPSPHFHSGNRKQRVRASATTTSTTTTATPPAMYHNPYLFSLPYNYPQLQQQYVQQLQALSGHRQSPLPRPAEQEAAKFSDEEPLASPNENRNVINVNIADPRKVGDSITNDASGNPETPSATRFPVRRGSFNSMANGLAKKALSSILYRIFPTMKHLNVKGVAARGCRDVQSIGSLDSIIMPLGLAVTLHPLLLPLVPFLLLALGSIKAIESATCFVSEYFT